MALMPLSFCSAALFEACLLLILTILQIPSELTVESVHTCKSVGLLKQFVYSFMDLGSNVFRGRTEFLCMFVILVLGSGFSPLLSVKMCFMACVTQWLMLKSSNVILEMEQKQFPAHVAGNLHVPVNKN